MHKITLPDNHLRAASASMFIVEKLVDELEAELLHFDEKIMKKIDGEDEAIDLQHYKEAFRKIRASLRLMADKYNLPPSHFDFSQIINSRKSKMWEVLSNTKSKRLKGFGKFPAEYAGEFDADLEELLKLVENI